MYVYVHIHTKRKYILLSVIIYFYKGGQYSIIELYYSLQNQ